MNILKSLFSTGIIRPQIGGRVLNKDTRQLGTVMGKSKIKGSVTVYAINVKYDNGTEAFQVSENEFIPVDLKTRTQLHPRRGLWILDYRVRLKGGDVARVNGTDFHKRLKDEGEQVGTTFQTRLEQLRRFTGLNVKDWEMIDEEEA